MIELLEMRHSPYCIPIARMLEGCSVPLNRREIPNWDRREIGRLTGGKYYQVPVLIEDGQTVYDLPEDPYRVARCVDQRHCGGRFFPEAWAGVHEILIGEFEDRFEGAGFKLCDIHYVASIADEGERAMVIRHKERRFGIGCLEAWQRDQDALRTGFEALLEPLEGRLKASRYLLGPDPFFADFALYGVLGNYTFKGWNQLPSRLKAVSAWFERMAGWQAKG